MRLAAACCALNPLHGPASLRERLRVPGGGPGTELPVCSLCSDYLRLPFVSPSPGLLLLPGPRRTRVPYLEAARCPRRRGPQRPHPRDQGDAGAYRTVPSP
ncbi:hypothetical protein ACFQVA_16140 [Actinomadura keratinilytica]